MRQLAKPSDTVGVGDVLLVTRLDRLARSTRDLLNMLATISDKGAGFRSLADAWDRYDYAAWEVDVDCPRWLS